MVIPSTSRCTRPLKRSTMPFPAQRIRAVLAMLYAWALARNLKAISREARAAVGQHVRDLEGKGSDRLLQEGHCAALRLVILDGELDEARAMVDGDIEVPASRQSTSAQSTNTETSSRD